MWRFAVVQFFVGLAMKLWPAIDQDVLKRKRLAALVFLLCVLAVLATFVLTGCGMFGPKAQIATRLPLYTYKADIKITIDGVKFDGMAVTKLDGPKTIKIKSKARLDMLSIASKHREFTVEKVDYDSGWFGLGGKSSTEFTYDFAPTPIEMESFSPLYIQAFEKNGIAAWGYIAFRSNENLPAILQCNGRSVMRAGISPCQSRVGFEQGLTFDREIYKVSSNSLCKITQIDEKEFRVRTTDIGFCLATFLSVDGERHRLVLLGYDEILVRD